MIGQHESARQEAAEQSGLERRRNELLTKRRLKEERAAELRTLKSEGLRLLNCLSELWDERFAVRQEVVARINEALSPVIRVRLLQFGNPEKYRELLDQSLRGTGVKQGVVAGKIVEALSPSELTEIVHLRDNRALFDQAGLNL